MNFMNGICSGLSALSTERRIMVAESSQILVQQLRRQRVGEDARRFIKCCNCSNFTQCNNYELFDPLDSIEERVRPFQDLTNSKRATLIEFLQSLVF
jgi:hypothetical protein